MFRNFLSSVVQKKSFLMFFTCVIYILGLYSYFTGNAILISFLMLTASIFAIMRNYLAPKIALFWYFIFFLAFFNASLRIKSSDALYQIAPQDAIIQGQIVSIPMYKENKTKFFVQASKIIYSHQEKSIRAKTLVSLNRIDNNLKIGDFYSFQGKLKTPFTVANPSQFDYGKYLQNFNTFTLLYVHQYKKINQPLPFKWKFLQGLNNIRTDIIKSHGKYLKSPNLELLGGMVFGDDAIAPPDEIKNSFANAGLLHLLAASGMNVALIYGIWFFILKKLKAPFNFSVSSGIFIVILYSLMTGLGPSVIRATIMLIFILIGKLIDRDADSISLLSFVALLMLIYNPAYINDVGFQLSFIVTFGLLLMCPVVFEKVKFIPNWLSGIIFIPMIAQIWVAPIQMYYFNSFSLYSVFANIIILPFVTVVSFGGFISSVLALIKPLSGQICYIFDIVLNPFLNIIVWISEFFSHLPNSLIQTVQPSGLQITLYYSIVLLIILSLNSEQKKKMIIATSLLSCMLIFSFLKFPDNNLETIVFSVGNADAFLVKTPKNKYFLIDSGKISYQGGRTQAQMIILAYLKDKGIKNIEGLIITHFDSDHAGGALDLINNLNIKAIYVNSLNDKSKIAQEIYSAGKNKIKQAKNNGIIYTENQLTIKNFITNLTGEKFENENSIITLISDGSFDELFMGDAGIIAFEKIKNYLPKKIEILKVGHHGAKDTINKNILDRITPEVAIISTGINNYGHPNGVILDILSQYKVKTFRTDRKNAIKINYSNNTFKVYSYNKEKGFVTKY